jgi:predicted amidophosphoribosyltransferase
MKTAIKQLNGNWDLGYALDKHVLSSIYLGDDEHGHPRFDNTRSEAGEALFRLKYRADWAQVPPIALQLKETLVPLLQNVGLIIPMPASTERPRQPVTEIARELGRLMNVPVFENLVSKAAGPAGAPALKNLTTKDEKVAALAGRFTINSIITNEGKWNALVLDDLFDTGASMEAVGAALRTYPKIDKVYAAAITWK